MERWEDTEKAQFLYDYDPDEYFEELIRRYPDKKPIVLAEEAEEVEDPTLQLGGSDDISD